MDSNKKSVWFKSKIDVDRSPCSSLGLLSLSLLSHRPSLFALLLKLYCNLMLYDCYKF
jgi:hypothetical protein